MSLCIEVHEQEGERKGRERVLCVSQKKIHNKVEFSLKSIENIIT
uniref:Uncharacterized protein n=1 Tax=Anopheles quadriannulatus TaxID=34691 RepID=A0A182X0Q4_ANOQN